MGKNIQIIMDKNGVIKMNNFQLGMAPSMHMGTSRIINADLTDVGVLKVQFASCLVKSVRALPRWLTTAFNGFFYYCLTADGVLWESGNATSWTEKFVNSHVNAQGNGLAYWNSYVFIARSNKIDVFNPATGICINDWATLDENTANHPMIVTRDNVLYIADGGKVFKIKRVGATFDPTNSATYVLTPGFLDVKQIGLEIKALSEIGTDLACGVSTINGGDTRISDVYYWNSNTSTDLFTTKISIQESSISAILNVGNLLYVIAGTQATVYVCNTVDFSIKKKMSFFDFSENIFLNVTSSPGAIAKHNDEIVFGVTGGGPHPTPIGVYSLATATDSNGNVVPTIHCRNTISTGHIGESPYQVEIGAVMSISSNQLFIGWAQYDGTTHTYGIDCVGESLIQDGVRYSGYQTVYESQLYRVGTFHNKKTFQQLEFALVQELRVGEGLKFNYRTTKNGAWIPIIQPDTAPSGKFDFAHLGAVISHNFPPGIPECEFVEIQALLTANPTTGTTPQLRELILL